MFRILFRTVLILTLVQGLGALALAQGTTGSILGVVYDQSQAVLPGVTITATYQGTGQQRQGLTDDQGRYVMAQLRVGSYTVQAELPGFQTTLSEVTLTLQSDAVINFTLTVGAAGTEIVVTSEAPLVETTSSSLKGLVDTQQIRDLPLNGRSFTDLVGLQTGVSINYNQLGIDNAKTPKFNLNGARSTMSTFQLDGTDLKNSWGMTPGSVAGTLLGVDTIQEFSVITGVASAEYGGFAGGVINAVTRSGSNELHGTVFYFHRNDNLDARNFFDRSGVTRADSKNEFKRNQYGFTLGGPIIKDKLFFFGSFEGLNERLPATLTDQVPSLDARRGIFSPAYCTGLGLPADCSVTPSSVTQPILDTYPVPNGSEVAGSNGAIFDYIYSNPTNTDEYYYLAKIDWQATDQDSIAGRWLLDDSTVNTVQSLGLVDENSQARNQYLMLQWTRIVSTKLVNEARASFNRSPIITDPTFDESRCCPVPLMHFNPNFFTNGGQPRTGQIGVSGGIDPLGYATRRGRIMVQNRFQWIDNLSYTSGPHSLKLGFNIHRIQTNREASSSISGIYTFRNIRDLVANATPFNFDGALDGPIMRGYRQTQMNFYVQDDWRVLSNLTLNIGIRYEPYTVPTEVAGRVANARHPRDTFLTVSDKLITHNPSFQNFAPRIGFAWDPFRDGKTSIRGGYGLFYDNLAPVLYNGNSGTNPPFNIRFQQNDPPFPVPAGGGSSAVIPSPTFLSDLIEQAGIHQFQLAVQREVLPDLMVQIDYRGSHGYNLPHSVDRNYAIPTTDANGIYPFWPLGTPRPNSAFGAMRDTAFDASSWYNALGVSVRKRFGKGYSLQMAYTYGKSIDESSSTGGVDTGGTRNGLSQFPFDINFDKGLSGFDVRNRLVLNGSLDLPFGRGRTYGNSWNGAVDAILGGWSINGILTAADGNKATVAMDNLNISRTQPTSRSNIVDRPNLIAGGDNNPVLSDGRDPNNYFDATQWEVGPAGYLGTAGRNTITNPGIITLDFSILKNIAFGEGRSVQFRAEFFNIANRANFEQVGTFFGGSASLFNANGSRNPGATRILNTSVTNRQIQLALKINF